MSYEKCGIRENEEKRIGRMRVFPSQFERQLRGCTNDMVLRHPDIRNVGTRFLASHDSYFGDATLDSWSRAELFHMSALIM